jgi:hypothetical protein
MTETDTAYLARSIQGLTEWAGAGVSLGEELALASLRLAQHVFYSPRLDGVQLTTALRTAQPL